MRIIPKNARLDRWLVTTKAESATRSTTYNEMPLYSLSFRGLLAIKHIISNIFDTTLVKSSESVVKTEVKSFGEVRANNTSLSWKSRHNLSYSFRKKTSHFARSVQGKSKDNVEFRFGGCTYTFKCHFWNRRKNMQSAAPLVWYVRTLGSFPNIMINFRKCSMWVKFWDPSAPETTGIYLRDFKTRSFQRLAQTISNVKTASISFVKSSIAVHYRRIHISGIWRGL